MCVDIRLVRYWWHWRQSPCWRSSSCWLVKTGAENDWRQRSMRSRAVGPILRTSILASASTHRPFFFSGKFNCISFLYVRIQGGRVDMCQSKSQDGVVVRLSWFEPCLWTYFSSQGCGRTICHIERRSSYPFLFFFFVDTGMCMCQYQGWSLFMVQDPTRAAPHWSGGSNPCFSFFWFECEWARWVFKSFVCVARKWHESNFSSLRSFIGFSSFSHFLCLSFSTFPFLLRQHSLLFLSFLSLPSPPLFLLLASCLLLAPNTYLLLTHNTTPHN